MEFGVGDFRGFWSLGLGGGFGALGGLGLERAFGVEGLGRFSTWGYLFKHI